MCACVCAYAALLLVLVNDGQQRNLRFDADAKLAKEIQLAEEDKHGDTKPHTHTQTNILTHADTSLPTMLVSMQVSG